MSRLEDKLMGLNWIQRHSLITDIKLLRIMEGRPMPRFQVRKYTQSIGEIEADSMEDAALLLRYGHGPNMWREEDANIRLVDPEKKMVKNIHDYNESGSNNQENILPTQKES